MGRLEKIKGVDLLINSVRDISSNYSIHLTVVGEGSYKDVLISRAESFGLMSRNNNVGPIVDFVGKKDSIEEYLNKAAIFVYPSICQEVFGISIVEAMAYGLLCIANCIGGIPEIIKDKDNGFLTAESTENGLTDCLRNVIELFVHNQEDEILRISNSAKSSAAKLSILQTCEKLSQTYSQINKK